MFFTIETKQNNKISSWMPVIFVDKVNIQQLSIENQLLVVYTLTLIALYLTPTKLV